jgi:hypothetical protein
LVITATRLARAVTVAASAGIGDDSFARRRHARGIGERQIALVRQRLGRRDREFPGLGKAVILEGRFAQLVVRHVVPPDR